MQCLLCHGDAGTQYLPPCTPSQPHSFAGQHSARVISPFHLFLTEPSVLLSISCPYRIPFLLCNIFWGPVFSDFGYKNICNLRQSKKIWKARSLINQVIKCSEINVHSKRLHHATMHYLHWLATSDTKRAFKMMRLRPWNMQRSPSHCLRGPLQHVKRHYRRALQACQATTYQAMNATPSANSGKRRQQCPGVVTSKDNYTDYTCLHRCYCWNLLVSINWKLIRAG